MTIMEGAMRSREVRVGQDEHLYQGEVPKVVVRANSLNDYGEKAHEGLCQMTQKMTSMEEYNKRLKT